MELAKQIKKYRTEAKISQEELAEKVFVSRQTISNWENDKSYPDVKSLILISEVFEISLDILIKGDIEKMKKEIDMQEYARFQKDSIVLIVLFVFMVILPIPLVTALKWIGIGIYAFIASAGMYYAIRVEKYKKKYDIQTYKEIVAFTEGKTLDDIEKAREEGKRPYQKVLLAVGAALLTVLVSIIISVIIKVLS